MNVQTDRDLKLVERYDAYASAYKELWAPTLRLASARLLRELADHRVGRIVDVGTGVGILWPDLRAAFPGALILGVDRSSGMLHLAPAEMPRVVADARALPLQPGQTDLALFLFMLFHLDDPLDGVREARRILRRGGTIGTVTWGGEFASPAMQVWTECLDEYGAGPLDPVTASRDELMDTPGKMRTLLQAGGFEIVRAWSDDLESVIDLEHLLKLKTRMGSEKVRYDSLDAAAREQCVAQARRRMAALPEDAFTTTGPIIYAIAS
jgi:ubiquinone/menaquinone biosynthesis C-methylase UbiE